MESFIDCIKQYDERKEYLERVRGDSFAFPSVVVLCGGLSGRDVETLKKLDFKVQKKSGYHSLYEVSK